MHDPGDHAPFAERRPAPAGPRPGGPYAGHGRWAPR